MDVRSCKSCKRLFNYLSGPVICSACVEKLEEKFKEVQEAYRQIMDMRSGNGQGYQQGYQGSPYQQGGYQQGGYQQGYQGNQQYNRQQYQQYGNGYGRNPYGGSGCGTGNLCCDLWCADTLCECMGGDLCTCF